MTQGIDHEKVHALLMQDLHDTMREQGLPEEKWPEFQAMVEDFVARYLNREI